MPSATAPSSAAITRALHSLPSATPIATVYARFCHLIDLCQPFLNAVSLLEQKSWILEPEYPIPFSALHRRIAIAKSCWLEVQMKDPVQFYALPSLRLLGNEELVGRMDTDMRQQIAAGAWNTNLRDATSLYTNLLSVLQLSALPQHTQVNQDAFALECGICWSYLLEGHGPPSWLCPHARCRRAYHASCLVDWLQTLSTTRIQFQTCYGTCPNCSEKIIVDSDQADTTNTTTSMETH